MRNPHHYLTPSQRVPGYLPYPQPVSRGGIPVPNASSIDWPQSQFAPDWFPPGSRSFQPYVYPDYEDTVVLYGDAEEVLEGPLDRLPPTTAFAIGVGVGLLAGFVVFSGRF